ncbi:MULTISPECIES: FadR/GntR family transcriptional regulator [Arthrobacter]|uniref:FadR family transcriptional regulator n=1 Tax=Arthrobacter terricola TaxID=2547396 RepID=A0A4R5KB32_9MICC|nr:MULTISPECIES: FadR/GntR family transcriptional regulator [Arthrobacter]MBT8162678.1 FadR family transcriptional regulator [Arthrobacter sp. GN70]TDF92453.1 FadR family transcriptional regulator [Arthrobacter terricola]
MTVEVPSSTSVPEGIIDHLKGRIGRGELNPGDRLAPERQLAESLGVGRVSLREALRKLQEDGYLEVRRGKTGGTFVTDLDKPMAEWRKQMVARVGELDDITELRLAIETHAAALAAERRSDDDLKKLKAAITQQSQAANRGEFRQADSAFHEIIGGASGSVRLAQAARQARGEFFVPVEIGKYEDPVEADAQQHMAIYEAIRDGDAPRACQEMSRHINYTRTMLRRFVDGLMSNDPA